MNWSAMVLYAKVKFWPGRYQSSLFYVCHKSRRLTYSKRGLEGSERPILEPQIDEIVNRDGVTGLDMEMLGYSVTRELGRQWAYNGRLKSALGMFAAQLLIRTHRLRPYCLQHGALWHYELAGKHIRVPSAGGGPCDCE